MLGSFPQRISSDTKVDWCNILLKILSVDWHHFLSCHSVIMDLLRWWSLSPYLFNSPSLIRFPLRTLCQFTLMLSPFPEWIPAEIDRNVDFGLTSWEDIDPISLLV